MRWNDNKSGRYILDKDGVPVPCEDLLKWARWIEDHNQGRIVRQEDVLDCWVSTVFLGLDHAFGSGPPILYETIVFSKEKVPILGKPRRESLDFQERAPTRELALECHARAIQWVKDNRSN